MTFGERARRLGFSLSPLQEDQFEAYMRLLLEWNQRMDLTNVTEVEEIENRHFLDSLSIMRFFSESLSGKWVDIGSGAGFPGIPLKILNPDMEIVLLDSLQKRVHFLERVIADLRLEKACAIHGRAEDYFSSLSSESDGESPREFFDFAISRAVAPLPTLLEYALPAVRVGGAFLSMKGPAAHSELEEAEQALTILGGEVECVDEFEWTENHWQRTNLLIRKTKNSPDRYPRKGAKPRKRPLGM